MYQERQSEMTFIVWLRAVSVVLILLTHLAQSAANPYMVMSAQIFNVGVNLFFLMSGFLFGRLGIPKPWGKWYLRRLKRIFVPYWLFLLVLLGLHGCFGIRNGVEYWLRSLVGMQGFTWLLTGAEQTWFITPILLCYLVMPLTGTVTRWMDSRWGGRGLVAMTAGLAAAALVLPVVTVHVPIFVAPLFSSMAYVLGYAWERITIGKKQAVAALAAVAAVFAGRLVAKLLLDGTWLYDRMLANYSHYLASFGILIVFSRFFAGTPGRLVRWLDRHSFEIYLCHYMFIFEPIGMKNWTPWWLLNSAIALAATALAAAMLHKGAEWFLRFGQKRRNEP